MVKELLADAELVDLSSPMHSHSQTQHKHNSTHGSHRRSSVCCGIQRRHSKLLLYKVSPIAPHPAFADHSECGGQCVCLCELDVAACCSLRWFFRGVLASATKSSSLPRRTSAVHLSFYKSDKWGRVKPLIFDEVKELTERDVDVKNPCSSELWRTWRKWIWGVPNNKYKAGHSLKYLMNHANMFTSCLSCQRFKLN